MGYSSSCKKKFQGLTPLDIKAPPVVFRMGYGACQVSPRPPRRKDNKDKKKQKRSKTDKERKRQDKSEDGKSNLKAGLARYKRESQSPRMKVKESMLTSLQSSRFHLDD
ncbi:hypothetical protein Tco_1342484 [Tanacetum coccineum]